MTNSSSVLVILDLALKSNSVACPFVSFDCLNSDYILNLNSNAHKACAITYINDMMSKAKMNTELLGVRHG